MKVSAVIPAYNESATLADIIQKVGTFVDETIVVIAKKNKDNSSDIAKSLGVKVTIDSGKGKGAALREAVEFATGEILLFIDSDGSHDPKDIPKLINPIKQGESVFVLGSRARGGSDELHGTFTESFRNMGGALIMLLINYRFNKTLTDCENGFRAIKKEVFKNLNLKANDFDIEQEMVIKALRKNIDLQEVPAHEYKRVCGSSRLNLLSCGWKFIWRLKDCIF